MNTKIFHFNGQKYLAAQTGDAYCTTELKRINRDGSIVPLVRKRHSVFVDWEGRRDCIRKEYYIGPNNWCEYSFMHKNILDKGGLYNFKNKNGQKVLNCLFDSQGKIVQIFKMNLSNSEPLNNNVKWILRKIGNLMIKI